ncbi:spore gernimation protein GerA [Gordoniibacillus kamchatkensis]|uniref:Spore gernimation protein GerA n=1 Tax=Gordoniibacillus kamchatkensis TaxID=1590651 RepID=A0ABR5ALE1_9BACL|nr:spore germination protein [Paenibacillus sp. VKM B-2647]KIL41865.1 spore gernimation protein GerA [Paenibacillus sp. VKM B-2647]
MNTLHNHQETLDWLFEQLGESADIEYHESESHGNEGQLLFVKSMVDDKKVQTSILVPFYNLDGLEQFVAYLYNLPSVKLFVSRDNTLDLILDGHAALFFGKHMYLVDVKLVKNEQISEISVEPTLQGPTNSLSENIMVNLNVLRGRYSRPSLKVEYWAVGTMSKTRLALVYDEQLVNPNTLMKVKEALNQIQTDVIQAAGELQRLLTKTKKGLFPTMIVTERPDRVVYNLSHGKIAFLLQGTPFALIAPAVFYDFMSSMDDFYVPYWVSRFLVFIRYIGLLATISLASLYVLVTSFNPEMVRVQLALSIAGSRAPVPYPSYFEVAFMLLMMELLTEASLRLPKSIGSTATTVGGLILGQAATQAGLVSNIMIIVVAAVAISNYVVPIMEMSYGIRVAKYGILVITSLFGLMGLVAGLLALLAYIVRLDSFGEPYFKLFIEKPEKAHKASRGKNNSGGA